MYTFSKEERLCGEKLVSKLFHSGSSFVLYPFKVMWLKETEAMMFPAKIVISAPKRRFKRSVDRNLLKRRIREAYRLHKEELLYAFLRDHQLQLLLGITFIGKEVIGYDFIERRMKAMLEKLKTSCNEAAG
ncbi:ribonuclease P protein component [Hufsiella ginkgonis]|nr:ribonuclease P protein component [Hufsiella ginkgonis]